MITKEEALLNKQRIQQEAEDAWYNSGCLGTLEMATGVGKSKIALNCIQRMRTVKPNTSVLLVTPTERMRDIDWPEEARKWEISLDDVKIVCQASLSKQKLDKYGMIVLDEYHNCGTAILNKLRDVIEDRRISVLGLTATLPSKAKWENEEERVGLLRTVVPSIYKITTDEAVDLGLVADFEVQVLKFRFDSINKNIITGGAKQKWSTTEASHYIYLTKELQKAMYSKNEGLKFMKMGQRTNFIYDLPSKYRLAKACLDKLEGRTLVMCGSIKQANLLLGDNVYHSESTNENLIKFQEGTLDRLGAVKALDEGVNLGRVDNLLIQQVQSTDRRLIQRCGRVLRIDYDNMGKKARIIILVAVDATGTSCDDKWLNEAIKDFDSKRISYHNVTVPNES